MQLRGRLCADLVEGSDALWHGCILKLSHSVVERSVLTQNAAQMESFVHRQP